jgi:pteridine reductase
VNGVSPGAILWPEQGNSAISQAELIERVPLRRMGTASDIAVTVRFLVQDAGYITGQIIAVDGGRSIVI